MNPHPAVLLGAAVLLAGTAIVLGTRGNRANHRPRHAGGSGPAARRLAALRLEPYFRTERPTTELIGWPVHDPDRHPRLFDLAPPRPVHPQTPPSPTSSPNPPNHPNPRTPPSSLNPWTPPGAATPPSHPTPPSPPSPPFQTPVPAIPGAPAGNAAPADTENPAPEHPELVLMRRVLDGLHRL